MRNSLCIKVCQVFIGLLIFCQGGFAVQSVPSIPSRIAAESTPKDVGSPADALRVLHLPLGELSLTDAKHWVDKAATAHFNAIVLMIWSGVKLSSSPWANTKYPWTPADLAEWAAYTKGKGLDVIIGVQLLSKQNFFFQETRPELMFNQYTYDPRKAEVQKVVFAVLDEVIDLVHPKAIHIGHDEVVNPTDLQKWRGVDQKMLPAKLFLQDVLQIHAHLKKRGVETWMWGDMLISPDEVPDMNPANLNGITPGYGKLLRAKIPKDIVICDWHYQPSRGFPSMDTFIREGFRVIGATWENQETIQSFSRYAKEHNAYGMMATVWYDALIDPDKVERIIRQSGEAFANTK
jgi:hypothetical protein